MRAKMRNLLLTILSAGTVTQRDEFPDLPEAAAGLPRVTDQPCDGDACGRCVDVCPTEAIFVSHDERGGVLALDRGRCIQCGLCLEACPTGALAPDRSTRTAVRNREALAQRNRPQEVSDAISPTDAPFARSLHVRAVSTGCNATDLEVQAATNPIFDVSRYGVHLTASPRFADALLVTGPVGRAMQEPLRRCYDAMAEPRLVIAAGTCAISGGVHRDGYAEANGVDAILPVAAYIPGCPPHAWSIIHGLLLAMGREESAPRAAGARERRGKVKR
jgi:Ni,Fe-hydrogenase III small subunit/ferredoxin